MLRAHNWNTTSLDSTSANTLLNVLGPRPDSFTSGADVESFTRFLSTHSSVCLARFATGSCSTVFEAVEALTHPELYTLTSAELTAGITCFGGLCTAQPARTNSLVPRLKAAAGAVVKQWPSSDHVRLCALYEPLSAVWPQPRRAPLTELSALCVTAATLTGPPLSTEGIVAAFLTCPESFVSVLADTVVSSVGTSTLTETLTVLGEPPTRSASAALAITLALVRVRGGTDIAGLVELGLTVGTNWYTEYVEVAPALEVITPHRMPFSLLERTALSSVRTEALAWMVNKFEAAGIKDINSALHAADELCAPELSAEDLVNLTFTYLP